MTVSFPDRFFNDTALPYQKIELNGPFKALVSELSVATAKTHDLGKAIKFFQDKMQQHLTGEDAADPVRHEWISALLLETFMEKVQSGIRPKRAFKESWAFHRQTLFGLKSGYRKEVLPTCLQDIRLDSRAAKQFDGPWAALNSVTYAAVSHHKQPVYHSERGGRLEYPGMAAHVNPDAKRYLDGVIRHGDFDIKEGGEANLPNMTEMAECLSHLAETAETFSDKFLGALNKDNSNIGSLIKLKHCGHFAGATLSRAIMILADQMVSGEFADPKTLTERADWENVLWANTDKEHPGHGKQKLNEHVSKVEAKTRSLAQSFLAHPLPCLSRKGMDRILSKSDDSRFAWQDTVTDALADHIQRFPAPTISIVPAGTGSGKTIVGAKIPTALRAAMNEPVTASFAVDLRTLALQHGDEMRKALGLTERDSACIIGDKVTQKIHESAQGTEQTHFMEESLQMDNNNDDVEYAPWLDELNDHYYGAARLVDRPFLQCTIDSLVKAAQPNAQAHHAIQLMRIWRSDLVIDEFDHLEPSEMKSVLMLIYQAGLARRHVTLCSATISPEVAAFAARIFAQGVRASEFMHRKAGADINVALLSDKGVTGGRPGTSLIKNIVPGRVNVEQTLEQMYGIYSYKAGFIEEDPQKRIAQRARLIEVEHRAFSEPGLRELIARESLKMHQDNHWTHQATGKNISFGLIRLANIKQVIQLCHYLLSIEPDQDFEIQVGAYHSNELVLQRHFKEKRLDALLKRKTEDHLQTDAFIHDVAAQSPSKNILFLLVATPVAEVGRDHHYDWGIFEPSSISSIIQAAGRIMRHARHFCLAPGQHNIGLLQYNFNAVGPFRGPRRPAFIYPGFEPGEEAGQSATRAEYLQTGHDLKKLLPWLHTRDHCGNPVYSLEIHSGLITSKMNQAYFATLDEKSRMEQLQMTNDKESGFWPRFFYTNYWMFSDYYPAWRAGSEDVHIFMHNELSPSDVIFDGIQAGTIDLYGHQIDRSRIWLGEDWHTLNEQALLVADQLNLERDDLMSARVPVRRSGDLSYNQFLGFAYI